MIFTEEQATLSAEIASWLLCERLIRSKYQVVVHEWRESRNGEEGAWCQRPCLFARWCSPFDGHIEGEHRTYVRTKSLATGRSLARSLDQGRSYLLCTYMSSLSSAAVTGCPWSTANVHSTFKGCPFCAPWSTKKIEKKMELFCHITADSNRVMFTGNSQALIVHR